MQNAIDMETVQEFFPELSWISDEELRVKCCKAISDSFIKGGWTKDTMKMLPVSVTKVHCPELLSGITHVRTVTKIAVAIYDSLEDAYHKESGLRDMVIAGALLHDLGKPMEFARKEDGSCGYTADAKLMRHPLSGAILAAQNGLDTELVHIIATHSFEGDKSYKTLAAQIVCAADNIAFAYLLSFNP